MVDSWIRIPIMKSKTNTGKLDTGFPSEESSGSREGKEQAYNRRRSHQLLGWCKTNCTFVLLNFAV